ncbi:hypothetical protein [Prosthecochloris sp. HL-130-GSB]|jgi:hypothetical protein|nr:hypothetical protein [Prosthecochloris sp. HL-130-GSB]MBO8093113.1 hypothetical protein [Prosthecochloris sp.]
MLYILSSLLVYSLTMGIVNVYAHTFKAHMIALVDFMAALAALLMIVNIS